MNQRTRLDITRGKIVGGLKRRRAKTNVASEFETAKSIKTKIINSRANDFMKQKQALDSLVLVN